uniref:Uncharacterized protein n=1 Tax=Ditylum brightwellii TaxID=49249 RepID=A0A7S2A3Z7_9STRA|mmetsp:Transcript_7454/g.11202  ORF Transcript_7454/g.11202 Transcript_7454/m.11202 type:complete len:308 (+) Transcript_7454:114-1037(+)
MPTTPVSKQEMMISANNSRNGHLNHRYHYSFRFIYITFITIAISSCCITEGKHNPSSLKTRSSLSSSSIPSKKKNKSGWTLQSRVFKNSKDDDASLSRLSKELMQRGGDDSATTTTTTAAQPRTTAGLFNRSADEIRSSRNAATAKPFNPNNNNNANTATGAPSSSSSSAIRAARNRRRATAARLTASDIRIPDPGSMEPVRQGLMTLHTLLGNAELGLNEQRQRQQRIQQHRQEVDGEEKGEEELTDNFVGQSQQRNQLDHHPLNSHRQWYRGQWLDALDTVNQWLEATIVDIVLPSDLLGNWAVS